MNNNCEIFDLVSQKSFLENSLSELIYGSVEIRNNNNLKYIYVHYRENGKLNTKYVGEYSDELYNLIIVNNFKAKELKKEIKNLVKELDRLGYSQYSLTKKVKLNIDFAKRNLVDTIYKQAILEGVSTTYALTETIIEGGKISGISSDDVLKIVNLKHAWEFVLNENVIASNTDYMLLCQINKLVEEEFYYNAGVVRSTPVKIGGTNWAPSIPIESDLKDDLIGIINSTKDDVDKAIDLLLFVMKRQIFIDGNKRTAVIFANHYLISKGKGLIVISENLVDDFKKLLIQYYEGKDESAIKVFLKKQCYIHI